jgi:exopolysaccharide biosynthesis polyprenyl glycosylphosphotransferase
VTSPPTAPGRARRAGRLPAPASGRASVTPLRAPASQAPAAPAAVTPLRARPAAGGGRPRGPAGTGPGRVARRAALPAADLAALVTAIAVTGTAGWPAAVYAAAVLALLAGAGLHRLRICLRVSDQAGRILAAAVMPVLAVLAWLPAGQALRLVAVSAGLLLAARAAASAGVRALRVRGVLAERALVVGAGETGTRIAALLRDHPGLGLSPRGFLDSRPPPGPAALPVLGRPADLGQAVREHGIGRVIVAFPDGRDEDLVPLLRAARSLPADVCVVPRLHELGLAVPRACLDEVWGIPLIPLRRPGRAGLAAKRAFDVAASLAMLVLLGIPLLVLGLVVRCQLRRPALFRQVRVTGPGALAEIVKLRTLSGHGDPDTCWVVPAERTTRLGRFLRATHADELPQLINVLRGQMSLVGPRPERPYFARRFAAEFRGYRDRHRVRSGLTGWAQVHGLTGDTSIADRAAFDNAYIENWSFWLDLSILARTVGASAAAVFGNRGGQQ